MNKEELIEIAEECITLYQQSWPAKSYIDFDELPEIQEKAFKRLAKIKKP